MPAAGNNKGVRWRASHAQALTGLLLALLVIGLAGTRLWRERLVLEEVQQDKHALLARVLADHAARSIDEARIALATLSDLAARGGDPAAVGTAMAHTRSALATLRGVAWVDANGQVLASADASERGLRIDSGLLGPWPRDRQIKVGGFIGVRGLADLQPGAQPVVPPGVGVVPVMMGVSTPSGATGMMMALLNPDAWANFQQLTLADDASAAALVQLNGAVLAATPSAELDPGSRVSLPALAFLREGREHGHWTGPGLRPQVRQLAAFRALQGHPLLVVVETGEDQVHAHWLQEARAFGGMALLAVAALLTLSGVTAVAVRTQERARAAVDAAQLQVAARERELSAIFRSVQDLLFQTDELGRLTFVNERWTDLTGQSAEVAIGTRFCDCFDDPAAVEALFLPADGAVRPGRRAQARLIPTLWPDSALRHFDITVVPLAPGWAGSATDVTELLAAQAELKAKLGLASSLLASSPVPTSVLDPRGHYLDVNRAWEQFTGRARSEVLGSPAASYLPQQEASVHDARDRELIERGGEVRYDTQATDGRGQRRDLFISKSTFEGPDGGVAGIVVAFLDISEFREAERATLAARDAALAASEAKSGFIANMSHELRTPLQSILGFSEIGRMRAREHPRLMEMFDDVHRAGQRMLSLVNDLLDLAKIENMTVLVEPKRQDVRPLVAEVAAELAPLQGQKQLEVLVSASDAELVALIDAPRLQQVIRNVLANAIRFAPPGSAIDIRSQINPDRHIQITIDDRGPGVPEAELESIFEAFVQSSLTKDGSGGTGLGLAICRRIMQAHDGTIHARNRSGGGTRFAIELPAAPFGETRPLPL